jgi:hypothetical protein
MYATSTSGSSSSFQPTLAQRAERRGCPVATVLPRIARTWLSQGVCKQFRNVERCPLAAASADRNLPMLRIDRA